MNSLNLPHLQNTHLNTRLPTRIMSISDIKIYLNPNLQVRGFSLQIQFRLRQHLHTSLIRLLRQNTLKRPRRNNQTKWPLRAFSVNSRLLHLFLRITALHIPPKWKVKFHLLSRTILHGEIAISTNIPVINSHLHLGLACPHHKQR